MFEFLEIPESSSEEDILERINDKLTYFQRLSENAPNDFLKKLHIDNVNKVRSLQTQILNVSSFSSSHNSTNHVSINSHLNSSYLNTSENLELAQRNKEAVAWLVRHTENKSSKPFPLFYGKNFIGRNNHPSDPTIIILEDNYISRIHCCINVVNIRPLQIIVSDDGVNSGKPSKNGTYVNGHEKRIVHKVTLFENDTVQVGMTKFILRYNNTSIKKIVQEVEECDYMKTVIIDIF